MDRSWVAGLAVAIATFVVAPAQANVPDERVLEPQIVVQREALGDNAEVELAAGRFGDVDTQHDGFVKPSLSWAWTAAGGDALPSLALGQAVELARAPHLIDDTRGFSGPDIEIMAPLVVGYGLGSWSLSSELAYHLTSGPDEWTLATELAVALGGGLGLFGVAKASATPRATDAAVAWHGGATFEGDVFGVVAAVGRGIRDTPFDGDEWLMLLAARLEL